MLFRSSSCFRALVTSRRICWLRLLLSRASPGMFSFWPRSVPGGEPSDGDDAGERGPSGLRAVRVLPASFSFSFAFSLLGGAAGIVEVEADGEAEKTVLCAGGECLIGESAENTAGIACCRFVCDTPRAAKSVHELQADAGKETTQVPLLSAASWSLGCDCERVWPWAVRVGAAGASLSRFAALAAAFSFPPALLLSLFVRSLSFSESLCFSLFARDAHGETMPSNVSDVERECDTLADFPANTRSRQPRKYAKSIRSSKPQESTLTMRMPRLARRPVRVLRRLGGRAPEIGVGQDHPPQQLLDAFRHLPRPDPLAAEGACPVFLQVGLGRKLLAFRVLKGRPTDENLEECNAERPDV